MIEKVPNFKEFRSFGTRAGSNYIGITGNGTISLYSGFYRKNGISSFEKCIILYDSTQKLLGLQFGNEELGHGSFRINHNKERKTGSIAAQSFFKINDELSAAQLKGRYIPEEYKNTERSNAFMIDLNEKAK